MPFDNTHDDEAIIRLPSDDTVTTNLIKGYHAIKRGWTQHHFYDSTGAVCALGALGIRHPAVYANDPAWMECNREIYFLSRALGESHSRSDIIALYNDRSSTNQQHILYLYIKAIKLSRVPS